jgi:hypothetical protein
MRGYITVHVMNATKLYLVMSRVKSGRLLLGTDIG